MLTTPAHYRIRVQGQLGQEWATWFGGLTMTWEQPGETVFTGQVIDQAALHGILNIIRDLGLPLLEVRRLDAEIENTGR
jgi:hypothetical protein